MLDLTAMSMRPWTSASLELSQQATGEMCDIPYIVSTAEEVEQVECGDRPALGQRIGLRDRKGADKVGGVRRCGGRVGCGAHFLNLRPSSAAKKLRNKLKTAIFGRGTTGKKRLKCPISSHLVPLSGQPGIVGALVRRGYAIDA